MLYADAITVFREKETQEIALLVADRPLLRHLLACWPMVTITVPEEIEDGLGTQWRELWKASRFKMSELAELMGTSQLALKPLVNQAKKLYLIYPDGSIHKVGKILVQRRLRAALTEA